MIVAETAANPELEAERRRALRALLRRPLLLAGGDSAAEYQLVRRHYRWLKDWLMKFPSWRLHLDRSAARLRKTPADFADDARPAVDAVSGTPFSKRRYVLLCLTLAALERLEHEVTLAQIAQTLMEITAADRELQAAGFAFDVGNFDQRRDLVHAIRYLIDIGALSKIDGAEPQFLNRDASSDVLYQVHRPVIALILNMSGSASSALRAAPQERLKAVIDDPPPSSENAAGRGVRSRLARMLLDDPVVYVADLNDAERSYLKEHRGYLLRQIHEATGLIPEVRREGLAMVDDAGDLTDLRLHDEGVDGHLALLLAQWFAEFYRSGAGAAIPASAVEEYVRRLIEIHGSRWRKQDREPGAETWMTADALVRLRALRLIHVTADGVVPLPACGRYRTRASANEPNEE